MNDSNKTDEEKQFTLENFLNEFTIKQIEDDQLYSNKYKGYLHNFEKG